MVKAYNHRASLGCWINDMRNEGRPNDLWPYVEIDDKTIEDVGSNLELQEKSGFNEFVVFGLLVSHSWPLDIERSVDDDHKRRVNRILDAAHELGIKVLYGLGVYSWGFDEIIGRTLGVRGPNPHAMCGSKRESQRWMRRIIDYILSNFNIDGFHLESSDQGRCTCQECMKEGNVEYYSRLNRETAEYIRDKAPEKVQTVTLNGYLPQGAKIRDEDLRYLVGLSRHIDFLVDQGHSGHFIDEKMRREFVETLKCDFGTSGGFWVYPPQAWNRLRWFLPYTQRTGEHIKKLYSQGGRAIEYYLGPRINPSVEINVAFGGRLLSDAGREVYDVLTEVVEMLYKPKSQEACHNLVEGFIQAENAYFKNWSFKSGPSSREPPGELYLHNLPWDRISEYYAPRYMMNSVMDPKGRAAYKKELIRIKETVSNIRDKTGDKGRIARIKTCLENTIVDIDWEIHWDRYMGYRYAQKRDLEGLNQGE